MSVHSLASINLSSISFGAPPPLNLSNASSGALPPLLLRNIRMSDGEKAYRAGCLLANEMNPSLEPYLVCMHATSCECKSNYNSPSILSSLDSLPSKADGETYEGEGSAAAGGGGGSGSRSGSRSGSGSSAAAGGGGGKAIRFGANTIHLYEMEEVEEGKEGKEEEEDEDYGGKTPRPL